MAGFDQIVGWVATGLVSLGGGKFFLDLVTARSKGRKDGAEGSAILVSSASEYARQLTTDLGNLRSEFSAYRREQEDRQRRQDAQFRAHSRWDQDVARKLAEVGEQVEPPPPLYT